MSSSEVDPSVQERTEEFDPSEPSRKFSDGESLFSTVQAGSQQEFLTASKVLMARDRTLARIHTLLMHNQQMNDETEIDVDHQKRIEFYQRLEKAEDMYIQDGQNLFDVGIWIKTIADAVQGDEREFERAMAQWAAEEADIISKSLDQAKNLKAKMTEISASLLTSAHNSTNALRKKLKEQYFSFQSQLAALVENLKEEEQTRRGLAMTNIMLKEKVAMLKMQTRKSKISENRNQNNEDADNEQGGANYARTKELLEQRDLEIAQMRSNLDELKEKIINERNINLKKDAEIMALKEEAAGQAESGLASKDLLKSRESELRLLKLLQCSRDALDRNTIRSMGFGFDPKEMENVPLTLVNLPQEITKLYRVLDEYSKRLEQFQNLFPSEAAVNEALSSLKELHDTKKDNAQLLAANKKLMQMVDKYKEELAVEKEKVKSLQERAIAIEKSLKSLQDLPVLSSPPVDAKVNGVPIEEVSAIEKDSALTKALEKICRRIVTSHDTIVYDIIGAGPSKFSRIKLQSRLDEANDSSKADKLVEDVCKVVEEYIKQYWTLLRSQTGVKDLAETIHLVKKQSDSEVAEEREHVGELKKLKGMLREARIRPEGQSWVDDILERWTWTQKKWEKRKREIIEARAEAILKCAESVLHVVTLNTGIKLSMHDKQDIIRSLQVSCVGRGNAFWPPQHVFDETSEKNPSSVPSHRAHTAIEKSSQPLFSISRLPLHRVPHDEDSFRSRGRDEGSFKSNMQTEKDGDKASWRNESEHNTLTPPLNSHAREHSLSPRNTGNIESWRPPSSPVQGMYPIYGQEYMSPDVITMMDGDIQKSHSTSVRALGIWPSTMIPNARLEIGDYISHGEGGTRSTKQGYHLQGMQSYTDCHRPGLSPTLRQWSQSPRARNVAEGRIPTAPAILPDTVTGRAQRQERDRNRASKLPVLAKAKLQSSAEFYEQLTDTLECKGLDYSQTEADPSCRTPKPWTPNTPAPEHINTSKPFGHQKAGDIRHHFEIHDMRERDTSSHLSASRGSPRTADIMTGAGTTAPGKSPCDSHILRRTPVPPPGPRGAQTAR